MIYTEAKEEVEGIGRGIKRKTGNNGSLRAPGNVISKTPVAVSCAERKTMRVT